MLANIRHLLLSPATGPVATAIALVLALVLGFATNTWATREASYEARILELKQAAARSDQTLRTQLASCQAAGAARDSTETADAGEGAARASASSSGASAGARRLLETQPEGIDACARMESADQAVLSNLRK